MQTRRGRRSSAVRHGVRVRELARGAGIALAIGSALLAAGFLDRDSGLGQWSELRRDLALARGRIAELRAGIAARETEARALRDDPLAIESAIRTDLGLARPGEWVARERDLSSLRNP